MSRGGAPAGGLGEPGLRAAAFGALGLLGASIVLVMAPLPGSPPVTPQLLVPVLWEAAMLCVVGLAVRRAPSVAWLASAAATIMAATAIGSVSTAAELEPRAPAWLAVATLYRTSLIAPLAVAAGYAAPRGRRLGPAGRWIPAAAWGGAVIVAVVFLTGYVGLATGIPAEQAIGVPRWAWLSAIGAILLPGMVGDAAPAARRTRHRLAEPIGAVDGVVVRRPRGPVAILRTFVDELMPGRQEVRADAMEAERGRLAADLHAEVLPPLRRALAAVERGGSAEQLAIDLRAAVSDVEDLLERRRSIVLEELGLLSALEWLAERVETHSDVRITIDVADAGPEAGPGSPGVLRRPIGTGLRAEPSAPSGRPPRPVERAAFRVAQLALDNVTRHAPGASVGIAVRVGPSSLSLALEDDGPGLGTHRDIAVRAGRRGLADMQAEAEACGARLGLGTGSSGRGFAVRFDWPS